MKKLLATAAVGAAMLVTPLAAGSHPARELGAAPPDITRLQARQRADSLFEMFDLNHDGLVTEAEAKQVGQQLMMQRASSEKDVAPGIGGHTLKYLKHAFAGAQSVTRQQLEQAMLAHFDQMDIDRDGVLTAVERQQARQRWEARAEPGQ
jgi:Ca2+-binding EF-hand superfamily protein